MKKERKLRKNFKKRTNFVVRGPTSTCGFAIGEKIRCGLLGFGVLLRGFAVFGPPLRPPPKVMQTRDVVSVSNSPNPPRDEAMPVNKEKKYSIA